MPALRRQRPVGEAVDGRVVGKADLFGAVGVHDVYLKAEGDIAVGEEGDLARGGSAGRSDGRCRRSRSGLRCRLQRVSLEEVPHQVVSADLVGSGAEFLRLGLKRGVRPLVSATIDDIQLNCRILVAVLIAL